MLNKVQLIGNVGQTPEVKEVNGSKVASFSLATTEKYKDKSGEVKTVTEWHNVSIWGNLADVVEKYVKKGSKLYVEGKIKTDSYEKDGAKKFATRIICLTLKMLDSKPSGDSAPQQSAPPTKTAPQTTDEAWTAAADEGDDLPF